MESKKGEVVVIVGPSGCGKSTFLRCLNKLESINEGALKLDGQNYENEKKNIHLIREKKAWFFKVMTYFQICQLWITLFWHRLKLKKKKERC